MSTHRAVLAPLLALLLAGCPTSKPPADTSDTDGTAFACGDALTCAGTEVCVADAYPAECTNREDTGVPCPDGTTESMCGGAGIACCCEPAPAPVYRCVDDGTCGDPPACDCLGDVCPEGLECSAWASENGRLFMCEELPKP